MDLCNRVALVTGGGHRLGRAISLALAQAGMHLMIHYNHSEEQARQTQFDVEKHGVEVAIVQGDLTQLDDIERIVDVTFDIWGSLDVLVCNAGIWGATPLGEVTQERWDELYALNTRAPFFLAQHAAPHLRAASGCMIAISDVGMYTTWKHYTPYLSSKAALAMVSQNLARDMAPEVRVNAIAPGPVMLPENWNDEQREKAARSTLLKRVGTPEDIAQAAVFLAQADYITGVVLPVDGGQRVA
jgi:pteridine reductase